MGYKKLESQPATPEWLKAGAEYEIAELYGELNDTDNAIAALNSAVQLARMMITDNINRVDQQSTEIPQAQLPTRPADPFGGCFVLASAATADPKSAKRICKEVGRGAHGACGDNGSDLWGIPVSSDRVRSLGASDGRVAESRAPQACFRSGANLLGSATAVFHVEIKPRSGLRCGAVVFDKGRGGLGELGPCNPQHSPAAREIDEVR